MRFNIISSLHLKNLIPFPFFMLCHFYQVLLSFFKLFNFLIISSLYLRKNLINLFTFGRCFLQSICKDSHCHTSLLHIQTLHFFHRSEVAIKVNVVVVRSLIPYYAVQAIYRGHNHRLLVTANPFGILLHIGAQILEVFHDILFFIIYMNFVFKYVLLSQYAVFLCLMVGVSIDDAQALTFLGFLVISDKTELSFYFVNFCFNLNFFVSVFAYKLVKFFI